jgi:hypothetical protein
MKKRGQPPGKTNKVATVLAKHLIKKIYGQLQDLEEKPLMVQGTNNGSVLLFSQCNDWAGPY